MTLGPAMQVVQLEATDTMRVETATSLQQEAALPTLDFEAQLNAAIPPLQMPLDASAITSKEEDPAPFSAAAEPETFIVAHEIESAPTEPSTFEIQQIEKARLTQRLVRSAQELGKVAHMRLSWEEDGKQYTAMLTREPARDSMGLERVIAEVTLSERGRHLKTHLSMKRLAFSQFTQIVDRWDPFVQLHDDEIVGRFHTNTAFNLAYDSRTAPKFLGKVTTAARSYNAELGGRRRHADIFRGGIETRADRINLPNGLLPFATTPKDTDARTHQFETDTRITFFKDGSYSWRSRNSPSTGYVNEPSASAVHFIATSGVTLSVSGTIAGKIMIYSPERIVIEGNLRYARDPREVADSNDYLGLICDKNVEVAGPHVTGSGDLTIDAAIFARRRFVVADIDHRRTATLTIYGSLTAGTISATEPRYATKIDYDPRFERVRPPGFPTTDRYEVENWEGQWIEVADNE